MARLIAAARRRPGSLAGLSYLVVGAAVLAASIRPGRTLGAADVLGVVAPFSGLPGAGTGQNPLLSDVAFQFLPWLAFLGDALGSGSFPTWNPTLLGGVPFTPNGFVSIYYPAFWLVRWFSPFDALDMFVLFHLVWGALGLYLFSRVVGARPWPAWTMGLLGFAAAFWVHWSTHMVHMVGFVWLPWVLAAAHLLVVDPRRKRVAALAVAVGLWWLGANPQYAYYGTLALVCYTGGLLVARRATGGLLKPALGFVAALMLGAALAGPVLLPTLSVSDRILRGREPVPEDHVPRRDIIRVLVPDALGNPADGVFLNSNDELRMDSPFVGVAAVLFCAVALGAAGRGGSRRTERLLLAGGAAVVLILAFNALPNQVLYYTVPGYDRFRGASRWLSVLPAFALPLAALGLQDVLDGVRRARVIAAAACGVAALAVLGWYLTNPGEDAVQTYLGKRAAFALAGIALVASAVWLVRRWPKVAVVVVALAVLGEVAFHTPRWYPSVVEKSAYPDVAVTEIAAEQGGRLIHVGEQTTFPPLAPDLPMHYGLADAQGLTPLFPRDFDRYLRIVDDYGGYALLYNAAPPLSDGAKLASPLLDVLDVRTVIASDEVIVPEEYPRLNAGSPSVYARTSLGPAVIVPVARPATEEEMWEHVAGPGWDPARTAAVVGLGTAVQGGTGTVTGGETGAGSERWRVDAPQGGFLRVSGSWDEGWSARLDGKRVDVLRADGVFRGVQVPSGVHEVTFSYLLPAESRGRAVALVGLLLVLGIAFAPDRWWRRVGDPVARIGTTVVDSRFPGAFTHERRTRVTTRVHVASLVVGFVGVVWINRAQWFFGDEWAFLGPRGVLHGDPGLFAPHNEHWSTVPVLVYRGLYSLFGVRSYLPYVVVLAVVHVAVAHLLWRVMRRSGVDVAVATALCVLFLFLGAGAENILWAFQIGFLGSVACGLGALLLLDRDTAFDWPPGGHDVAVWAVLVLGLMCSGIGVPMVAVAAVAVLLRRGFGREGLARAGLVVSVPGAVYLGWLVLAGGGGIGDRSFDLTKLPAYLGAGVSNAFSSTLGSPLIAALAVLGLVAWMAWRRRLAVTTSTPAFACMIGVVLLFVVVALGRAALGTAQAEASRYVYLAIALALPVTGLMLTDLVVRGRAAEIVVVALVCVLVAYNMALLADRAGDEAARESRIRRTVMAGADMAVRGEPFLAFAPDPTLVPDVTTGILRRMVRDGKLSSGGFGPGDRMVAASWLQLAFSEKPIPDVVPPRLGPVVAATVTEVPGPPAGCVVLTPQAARPEMVLEPAGRVSVTVRSSAGGPLRATLQDIGPRPVAGERRSFTLEPGKAVNVNVVADVDQVVLAVPAAGTTEVCGL